MQHLFLISFTALFVLGCLNKNPMGGSATHLTQDNLEVNFTIKDANNKQKTDFLFGEDVWFEFTITNQADTVQNYLIDGGSLTTFELYSGDSLVGASDEGPRTIPNMLLMQIMAGQSISYKISWLANRFHQILKPGDYTVKARPRIQLASGDSLQEMSLAFQLNCPDNAACAGLTPVVIGEIPPPADIQKDVFALNGATLLQDTLSLNISYSGGCQQHDFTLFASQFMETAPVQVNVYLRHDANNDLCEAYPTEEALFDLQPLANAWRQRYGNSGAIILNIFKYYSDVPAEKISLEYKF